MAGACVSRCPTGFTSCGNACVDLARDAVHCGACDTRCPVLPNTTGGACVASACVAGGCSVGYGDCDGDVTNGCETSLTANDAHCGACGRACAVGAACVAGECVCPAGQTACAGRCETLGTTCTSSGSGGCETAGTRVCTSVGAASSATPRTTGVCTAPSGGACAGDGTCVCPAGQSACGGACVDVRTDIANCGACGSRCASGQTCVAGACVGVGWTLVAVYPLDVAPTGAIITNGAYGGQGVSTFGGVPCWNQTSDWNYLWIPHPAATATRIRVEVDLWANTNQWDAHLMSLVEGPMYRMGTYAVNGVGVDTSFTSVAQTRIDATVNSSITFVGQLPGALQTQGAWVTIRQDLLRDTNSTTVYRNGVALGTWPVPSAAITGTRMFLNSGVPNGSGGSNCWKNLRVYVSP